MYLPTEKAEYSVEILHPNVKKITFHRDVQKEWHGDAKLFDRAFGGIGLSWKTKFKWYTSEIYLSGLWKRISVLALKALSGFIFIKKYRKIFRDKYVHKGNKF